MLENIRGAEPAPTAADMDRVATELGVKFNEEYREFIAHHNGGHVDDNIFDIPPDNNSGVDGIVPLERLTYVHGLFANETGPDIIPIMSDGSGNYVCMDMSGRNDGAVYFLDHEIAGPEALTLLAPSLNAFLAAVRPDDAEVDSDASHIISVWVHPDLQKIIDEQKKKK